MRIGKAAALLVAIAGISPASARDLRVSDIYPPESPTAQALAYMGVVVERQSFGRLRIPPPREADRDSENFTIAQLRTGTLDMARVSLAALNTAVPSTAVLSAPFLMRSGAEAQKVLNGPVGAEILASLEQQDLIGLCFYDAGAHSIYTVDKPIRSVADVKGLKVGVQPGDIASTFWQDFGAVPLAMPYSRVAEGLRIHVLDGASGNLQSFVFGEHYKAVKYFSPTEHARPPGVVIFSKQVWKGLQEVDRTALMAAAKASAVHQSQLLEAYEAQARQTIEAAGVTIIDGIDMKSFKDPMDQLYPRLFPDRRQQDLLIRIKAAAAAP